MRERKPVFGIIIAHFVFCSSAIHASGLACQQLGLDKSTLALCKAYTDSSQCLADDRTRPERCDVLGQKFQEKSGISPALIKAFHGTTAVVTEEGGSVFLDDIIAAHFKAGAFDKGTDVTLKVGTSHYVSEYYQSEEQHFLPAGYTRTPIYIEITVHGSSQPLLPMEFQLNAGLLLSQYPVEKYSFLLSALSYQAFGDLDIVKPVALGQGFSYDQEDRTISGELAPGFFVSDPILTNSKTSAVLSVYVKKR